MTRSRLGATLSWTIAAAVFISYPLASLAKAPTSKPVTLAASFASPPADSRPMVRWWWFGSAVKPAELVREIKTMKAGGFGGFEIQPVYPLVLDDPAKGIRNLPYLSDEFLSDVSLANTTGRAEGLRVDITLGSGWPYGGPHISVEQASSRVQLVKIAIPAEGTDAVLPAIKPGEHRVAAFLVNGDGVKPDLATATPIAVEPGAQTLTFARSSTERALLLVMQTPTGQQVKRPGVGGEGNVLDHMDKAAVDTHLKVVGDRLMTAFGDTPPYAVFSDSLEVYNADWTDDLLDQFKARRGYDLKPRLLDLFFDGPDSANIRHDWALTLSELTDERYLTTVNDWAKMHKTRFRSQTYGFPPVTLSSNRLVALPEGEQPYWRKFSSTRWASSANHLYGNPVTSAESWTWLHAGAFRATPLDIKAEGDTLLLEGVNQFVAHGWPYSPPEAQEPGWAFYAAAVFNEHNPWWGVMPDVNAYLQRMSYLLRQGEPVADIAIFLPTDDALANIKPGRASVNEQMGEYVTERLTTQILDAGYSFDYVDSQSIAALGIKHKVLLLPRVRRIDPEVYKKIDAFAKAGGIVVAIDQLPDLGAGWVDADADTQSVRFTSGTLFGPGVGTGNETTQANLGATLKNLTPPDLDHAPAALGFVHRRLRDGDLYFVANTSNQTVRAPLSFRAQSKQAQWWEPRTGQAHAFTPGSKVTLAPYESRVFVFGKAASAPVVKTGKAQKSAARVLEGGWSVAFSGKPKHTIETFASWSDDPETAHYSGTATYSRAVTFTLAQIKAGQVVLDFGAGEITPAPAARSPGTSALLAAPVREAAEVFVNGKRAGAVWTAPFTVSLEGLVHPGTNLLEVRVANTAINTLAGRPPADYSALTAVYGERFSAQNMRNLTPLASGLLRAPSLTTPQ